MSKEQSSLPERKPQPHERYQAQFQELQRKLVDPSATKEDINTRLTTLGVYAFMKGTIDRLGQEKILSDLISVTDMCRTFAEVRSDDESAATFTEMRDGYKELSELLQADTARQREIFSAPQTDATNMKGKKA